MIHNQRGAVQQRSRPDLIAFLRRMRHNQVAFLRRPRHDQIAFRRQRHLAVFLLIIDLYVIALGLVVGYTVKWHPLTQHGLLLTASMIAAAMICLLLAAGIVGGLRDMWKEGISVAPERRHRDTDFFAKRRMIFFYTGVNLNILSWSLLVEQTGGITGSPYVAVFFAFILTGQQLSRFKTQSSFLISIGVVLTVAMWVYESTLAPPKIPAAPKALTFILVASTFFACGLVANYEKDHNYLVEAKQNLPTHAHVYRDGTGIWHYVIYCQRHRLDPIIGHDSTETGTESSLHNVSSRVEAIVKSMYQAAGWGQPSFEWPTGDPPSDLIVEFPANAAGRPSEVSY